MQQPTVVHVMRHGQVHNPDGVLYGRLPGFGLSGLGHQMAARLAGHWDGVPLTHLRCSPLQRAQETLAPTAALFPQLEVVTDERLTEAGNLFEGKVFGPDNRALRDVRMLPHVLNPLRPSWGEPYRDIAVRMRAALQDAAVAARVGRPWWSVTSCPLRSPAGTPSTGSSRMTRGAGAAPSRL